MPRVPTKSLAIRFVVCLWSVALAPTVHSADTRPADQLRRFAEQSGTPGDAARGRIFFATRHAGDWSCTSCHGSPPLARGRHAATGKAIPPLAPVSNPKAFTDTAKIDKWFGRNCRDVLNRPCTSGEQADVLAYLLSFN